MIQGWRLSYVFMLLILVGVTPSAAEDMVVSCGKRASSEAMLEQNVASLLSFEKVRQWERRLPNDVHMTAIPGKTDITQGGECYREITLYEMHSDHMTLWHTFLLGDNGPLIENFDGDWVPINSYEHW